MLSKHRWMFASVLVPAAALIGSIASPARAAPIPYRLDPPIISSIGIAEGTFTFDSSGTPSLLSVDITVTGGPLPGVFTVPVGAANSGGDCTAQAPDGSSVTISPSPGSCFVAANASASEELVISFLDPLSTTSNPVAIWGLVATGFVGADEQLTAGAAVPAPEPSSFALVTAGLVGLIFVRRRRCAAWPRQPS